MKILHIAESAQGGVGTYLTEILSDQARRFGEANIRALVPAQHAAHLSGVDRRLLVTWQRRERSAFSILKLAAAIRRQIAQFAPTVVHVHSSVAGGVLRLMYGWGKRPPFRIVYCPHGWAFDRSSSGMKRRLIERIERDLAPRADRIVLISEHEQREGLRIGIAAERMTLVLNGIADLHSDRPARWVDERVRVLFVGRLDTQKGFDTLLDAVAPIQDRVTVRVIGKAVAGPASTPRPHTPQIEYLGWRSLSEVATEIAAADVVAIPSRWEGFGLVALEAMCGSRAVVASSVGGLREIIVDGVTGYLVPPDSPERLMRALSRHDRATWQAMGRAGRLRYEEKFTARRMNAELATLYADLSSPPAADPQYDPGTPALA
ncbi:glycosyltransferase [Sphingomonas sp. CFBP8993]|uniref:glycosyltransferase n=1 Tax=Sphingomonas sp. CFBP8993 TaxID=3096526 RepID=UPI002A6B5042|nr:glycosyltransferase [Sphingomonas sp. CFBP8993]MDY0957163.1 glycosyltransferase [Sphingomonas sp. CFBP8993]